MKTLICLSALALVAAPALAQVKPGPVGKPAGVDVGGVSTPDLQIGNKREIILTNPDEAGGQPIVKNQAAPRVLGTNVTPADAGLDKGLAPAGALVAGGKGDLILTDGEVKTGPGDALKKDRKILTDKDTRGGGDDRDLEDLELQR